MAIDNKEKLLYKDLSYKLQGLFFEIRNDLGSGHKETIYQKALEKELARAEIKFEKEPAIKIYSSKGDYLGLYRPDFLIENKILVELKATPHVSKEEAVRVYDYLRNGEYELAYLVNFASSPLYIRRFIYTNNRKSWLRKFLSFVAISILFVAISGLPAQAARLYFEPQEREAGTLGEFAVALNLDAVDQINALNVAVAVPKELTPIDTGDGNSIINLWLDKPNWDEVSRLLTFSGIIPGGFGGRGGRLLVMTFKVNQPGTARLGFNQEKTEVYLNGPDGERDRTVLEEKEINITAGKENLPLNLIDQAAPEPFVIQLSRDPNIFNNQWFIAFSTQDKGEGLADFEICETYKIYIQDGEILPKDQTCWQKGESPYLLADQALRHYVFVKALDKKGNARIAILPSPKPLAWYEKFWIYGIIITVVVPALVYFTVKKIKRE